MCLTAHGPAEQGACSGAHAAGCLQRVWPSSCGLHSTSPPPPHKFSTLGPHCEGLLCSAGSHSPSSTSDPAMMAKPAMMPRVVQRLEGS